MAWVQTHDGTLVNLDHVAMVIVERNRIVAHPQNIVLAQFTRKEDADAELERLAQRVQAVRALFPSVD